MQIVKEIVNEIQIDIWHFLTADGLVYKKITQTLKLQNYWIQANS